ncbi:unnamed protein product, partial [Didymodactylos carnosus]
EIRIKAITREINVEGGAGNEGIEIGLWHANVENEKEGISQVILIGDVPANTKQEVEQKRKHLGEDDWKNTKFKQSIYYADELEKKIQVHAFFVEKRAEQNFHEIAKDRCAILDINSPLGSNMLTDLVTEEILRNFGGKKGDTLVDAYRNKFVKSYT